MDKESQIVELKGIIQKGKKENLTDFSHLNRMRKEVDDNQSKYDALVEDFKNNIGVNQDAINNLMVGIYNKYQNEILKQEEN